MKKKRNRAEVPLARPRMGLWLLVTALGSGILAFVGARMMAPRMEAAAQTKVTDEHKPSIDSFVGNYFGSWSEQDMKRYGECFHPSAVIWLVRPEGTEGAPLPLFLREQQHAHARSRTRMREYPLDSGYTVRNGLAQVWVYWELISDSGASRGYDFFTLAQFRGEWRIVSLVFNAESKSK